MGISERKYRVAMMFAGDPSVRATVKLEETRLGEIAKALRDVGLDVEAASYADEVADEVREQLLAVDGVLVWVDPVRKDGNRAKLDPILRDVASHGVFVSSHPDLILKMGTKEVLYRTRNMSWGTDTRLYMTVEQFRRELPLCLAEGKPRVLKQNRGNDGIGVWKVEAVDPCAPVARVRALHAVRGSQESEESLDEFVARCGQYFEGNGRIIDQVYQPRLTRTRPAKIPTCSARSTSARSTHSRPRRSCRSPRKHCGVCTPVGCRGESAEPSRHPCERSVNLPGRQPGL